MSKAERDYSHRTLYDKLGVKPEASAAVPGKHDEAFVSALDTRLQKGAATRLRGAYDLIFLKIDAPADLAQIERAAKHLRPAGGVWVFHPKGKGASPSDGEVRAAGLACGLVDNKISAYSETHTATRFVIPVARR